ncbi:OLC1v1000911C2 [Oldenlandia corymbosa var. corymbosa]|uniref:OLC1v1000911C2 n=1 Tax=Oldenlandia corymbosa var. corymbosa TaxID=529605 RepID=A0AAV1D6T8_OLDCO|nr:OLC1v1000911C2 [Oldenlandia corymbosa var. corymbosa]
MVKVCEMLVTGSLYKFSVLNLFPGCGESRSLKKELVNVIQREPERFGTLKLMLVYRNNERMLANALGASEGITVLYFHHSVSYKYGGRLRVQNLLASIHSVMSAPPDELPLKFLKTPYELRNFFDSTDKAMLLLDFCGWTPKLLVKGSVEESNGTQVWEEKKQKASEDGQMSCNVNDGFSAFPSFADFILRTDGILQGAENTSFGEGFSCTLDELQRLESFFPKFIKLARDFFLPPERQGFGVVSERSLLSDLVSNASASWLLKLYAAGCPSCSRIVGEGDDLKVAIETQDSIVKELRDDAHDVPTLPANGVSVILFIDRSSESLSVWKKSMEALHTFRDFALQFQNSNQNCGKVENASFETYKTMGPPKVLNPQLFSSLQSLNQKDKTSIMILNDGRQISLQNFISDLRGSSLPEVLANLLQDKNKSKFSSLAKDAGFQLLSNDFEIKGTDDIQSQREPEPHASEGLEVSPGVDHRDIANPDKDSKLPIPGAFPIMKDEETSPAGAGSLQQVGNSNPLQRIEKSSEILFNIHTSKVDSYSEDSNFEDERLAGVNEQIQQKSCSISFFFSDGGFRLLKALTAAHREIPSLVIVDPMARRHFILPESDISNISLLSDFLDRFLNGSLLPYQQSEHFVQSPREAPNPPFVNLDFHEADPIPRVTANTFAEMVIGNESYSKADNAWNTDVVVLFTNSWCGFCQRMETVVREAYRAIKGYANMLTMRSSESLLLNKDNSRVHLKVPLIFLMDCTLNDCSLMLKTTVQREVYPSVVLFPAGQKNAIIYKGDVAVFDVIKFLSDEGTLVNEKGVPWLGVEQGGDVSGTDPIYPPTYHEVLLKDQTSEMVVTQHRRGHSLSGLHESTPQVLTGSILTATDKLMNAHPFDESRILIVKVDEAMGFEGLILNKHIHWESLEELDENMKMLKDAPLSYGGPVMKHGMPLVALAQASKINQHVQEILPDVYFFDQPATLQLIEKLKLGNESVHGYWFFLGFSNWGREQLFQEIAEGAWDVSIGAVEHLDWPEVS